jgi:hypothetical protein
MATINISFDTIMAARGKLVRYTEPELYGEGKPYERLQSTATFQVGDHPQYNQIFPLQLDDSAQIADVCRPESIGKYYDFSFGFSSGTSRNSGKDYCMHKLASLKPTAQNVVEDAKAAQAAAQFDNVVPF